MTIPAPAARQVPRALVPEPPGPTRPPYDLLSAAAVADGVDVHQLNGVEYETVCNPTVRAWPPDCRVSAGGGPPTPGDYSVKHADDTTGMTTGDPFALYAAENCLLGNTDPGGMDRLRRRFTLGESTRLEWTFFHGQLGNRPSLRYGMATPDGLDENLVPTVVPTQEGAQPLDVAVGVLEQWIIATTGGPGMIHAPAWLATPMFARQIVFPSGSSARTRLGTVVVFGVGYPGYAPANVSTDPTGDGQVWLYGTPQVNVRRSNLLAPADWDSGAADLAHNNGFRMVERLYVLDVPCNRIAAVQTDIAVRTLAH